jgi:hypothetical protein
MDLDPDPTPDPSPFFSDAKDLKKYFFSYFFLITYLQAHYHQYFIRIREAQKHEDPADPDPQHWPQSFKNSAKFVT